ncbi:hypothetical protein IFR05_009293 [Cadophora sp. M221]|nr:hypothetical protein IFR05_009293 [Cadophora sp. M221]
MLVQTIFHALLASSFLLPTAMGNPLPTTSGTEVVDFGLPAGGLLIADLPLETLNGTVVTPATTEGSALSKRDSTFKPTYSATFQCPQAGAVSRTQIYEYDASVGRIISTSNIQNAETRTLYNQAATQLRVGHGFSMNFGNTVCCYTLQHLMQISDGAYRPTQVGTGALGENCVHIGTDACVTSSFRLCRATSQSFTYSFIA